MRDMGRSLLEDGEPCMHDLNTNALSECILVCLKSGATVVVRDANLAAANQINLLVDVVGSRHHAVYYREAARMQPVRVVLEGWPGDAVRPDASRTLDGRRTDYKLSHLG